MSGSVRGAARDSACRCRVLQQAKSVGVGDSGHRRTWRWGVRASGRRQGRGEATGDARMVEKLIMLTGRNGCLRYPTAGSRRSSASGDPVCGTRPRRRGNGIGMSGVEHQAVAIAPSSVRAHARRWDWPAITRIMGSAGSSGSFRVPCPPLCTCGVPPPVSIPSSDPACSSAHVSATFPQHRLLGVAHGSETHSSAGATNSLFSRVHSKWVCAELHSLPTATKYGTLSEGKLCLGALRCTNGVFDGRDTGNVQRSQIGLRPRRTKRLAKPMTQMLQKNVGIMLEQWDRVENAASERDVSANRLGFELAMEGIYCHKFPCNHLQIQFLHSSIFSTQIVAHNMIASGDGSELISGYNSNFFGDR